MTSLSECPATDRLQAMIGGNLTDLDQTAIARHLDDCEACQQALERLAAGESPFATTASQLAEAGRSESPEDRSVVRGLVSQFRHDLRSEEATGVIPSDASTEPYAWLDFLSPPTRPGILGTLAQYEVLELIGQGGMGMVLKALDPALNRLVAIKVMAPQLAVVAAARKRFAREARASAAVSHEHVVPIFAVDEFKGLPYLVMPFIAGESLQERLDRCGSLKLAEILRIGRQIAAGLAAAHAQGLIHRDIKPSNILLENGVERVKITDFGLAHTVDDATLTHSDVVVGTPQFMAPEQAKGEPLDPRSDLFSLGGVLYAMCLGRPPFRAPTALAVLKRVCEDIPRPIREVDPEVPEWLAAIIEKLLAKEPGQRFASAAEVSQRLEDHLARLQQPDRGEPESIRLALPPPRRSRRWAIAATIMGLGLAGLGWTEATEVTRIVATVATILRIPTSQGVLVLQVDDPDIKVRVDSQTEEIVITGAGVQEVRLRPGPHRLQAFKEGRLVYDELLTVTRGGKIVAKIGRETGAPDSLAAQPAPIPPTPSKQPSPVRPKAKTRAATRPDLTTLRKELDDLVAEYHHLMKGPLAKDADVFRKLEDRMIALRKRIKLLESRAESATPSGRKNATALTRQTGDDRVPVEQIRAKIQAAPDPGPMNQLLAKWEAQSARLTTLDVRIYRVNKNPDWGEETHYEGRAVIKRPHLAYLDFKKIETVRNAQGKVPVPDPKDPEKRATTPQETIIYGENEVWHYLHPVKQVFIYPLAMEPRQRALDEGLLPFLFIMEPRVASERYKMTLSGLGSGGYSIWIRPDFKEDKEAFKEVRVTLDKERLLPVRIVVISPDNKSSKEFRLEHISPNVAVSDEQFQARSLKGWKVTRLPPARAQSRANVGAAPGEPVRVLRARPGREGSNAPVVERFGTVDSPAIPAALSKSAGPF